MPIVGPGEAAMLLAASLGHRFAIVTVLDAIVQPLRRLAWSVGVLDKLAAVRAIGVPVLELYRDLDATADPRQADNVLRTSGRGLLLIRAFVDRVDFKYREGRGMEVTLVKKRAARKPKTILASARP